MTYTIHLGSNLDILPTLPDNSVDSIVTDPPYGLSDNKYVADTIARWIGGERDFIPDGKGFMGKAWDSFVPPPALWDECLRVLKPGGHLLAFFGSRTQDIGALSIRLAGFEIRDSIAWMYGSGFPKSLDVSKAIDKNNGKPKPTNEFKQFLRAGKANAGLTSDQIDKMLGFTSAVFSPHYVGNNPQIEYPTKEKYKTLKELLNLNDSFDYLIDWAEAQREVTGHYTQPAAADTWMANYSDRVVLEPKEKKEKPVTPEAQQWEGWGTALKPAHEPIVVARKPLIGTVAETVLEHGTGGLNIDGSRIGASDKAKFPAGVVSNTENVFGNGKGRYAEKERTEDLNPTGRWPSNVILDPYTAELLDEQSDASRFFYVAKASKRDRNEGLDDLEPTRHSDRENADGVGGDNPRNRSNEARQNFHPTVKPTDLMRYLVKLVTPPGGVVLDPFTGSGSTGKAAILEGFDFIGIELTEEYLPIIEGRLAHAEQLVAERKEKEDEALF